MRRDFFARSVHEVAPELVGCTLLFDGAGGRIVELEAYDHEDPAAHGYGGKTGGFGGTAFWDGVAFLR